MIPVQHPVVSIVKKKRPAGLLRRKFSWMNKRTRVLLRKGDDYHPVDDEHKHSNVTIAGTDSETLDAAPSNEDRDIENHKSSVSSSTEDGAESQCQDRSPAGVGSNNTFEYGQHNHHNDGRDDQERQDSNDPSDDHCEHRDDAQDSNRHIETQATNSIILIDRIAVLEGELEWARRQHAYTMEQQKRQRQRDKRRAMQEARREVRENSHELKALLENLEQEMALTVERVRQDCQRHHELDLILALEKERLKFKAEHDSVLQDLTTAFENERSQLKAEHDAKMQDVTAAFEKERSRLKAKHDAILKKATGALKTELVAFKREASQKWQAFHQEHMDRQGQLQNDHKEQLSALERDAALMWEEHYLDQVEQLLQDQRDQILAARPQTSQEVEELLQHLDVAHQHELVELQLVHHKRLEAQMLEHERELEEIRRMLQVNSELLERSRKEMKTEKDLAVKEAVRKATQSFQKEMRLLVVNHSQSVDKLCQRHQEDMQEQRLVFEVERLNDRDQAMHEKLTLVKEHKRQIEQLGLDHEHELGRLRSEHENVLEDLENKRLAECKLPHSHLSLLRQQAMDESLRNLREQRDQNNENRDLDVLLEYCASMERIETEMNRTIGGPIAVLEKKDKVHGPFVENQSCSLSNVVQEMSCANTEHGKQFCALKATQREQETQNVHAAAQVEAVEASSRGAHVIVGPTDEELQKIENINRVRKLQGATEYRTQQEAHKQLDVADDHAVSTLTTGTIQCKDAFMCQNGGSNNAVETALTLQKTQFEEIINAQTLQLREATEYWEQQKMQWDATISQLEDQGERSQSELHDHYQYELRQVHRAMDAAIVEAQSQAATFIRTGVQKLKDMETERDEMIKQAVTTALEQQKMEFDTIINSQKLLLKEANARLEPQQDLVDLEAKTGTQSVPGTRDPILGDVETNLDQLIRQAVEVALKQQKVEFEAIISAHESKLQETTEYWEQQKIQWDASMIQLEEQGERSQSELHDHYQYELRHVHRAMDAAIVEAQSEATTFVRTGKQKLKDMETERDEMIKLAVKEALERQKMKFDAIINSLELLLKEANARLEQQQIFIDPRPETERGNMIFQVVEVAVSQQKAEFEAKVSAHESKLREITEYWEQQKMQWDASMIQLEEQGKRSQSELHDHYQYELRQVHRAMDAAIVEAQSEAATFVRAGMQKIKDMETERDEMIKQAVAAALEQQQPFCTQKSQLQEATELLEQQNGHFNGSTMSLEEEGKRTQSEPEDHDQGGLRRMHQDMDAAMFDAPLEASTFVRSSTQTLTDKKEPDQRFQHPKCNFQGNHPRETEQKQHALFFGDAIELQDLSHRNETGA